MSEDRVSTFWQLHQGPGALLLANAWDIGSARLLASMGFSALATTSSGYAATLGRMDGRVSLEEALQHSTTIAAATDLPVNADLENCFADEPEGVADTISRAVQTGVAGASVEDYTKNTAEPIYELGLATERVRAAAEAAHAGSDRLVLTARAENYLHDRPDLDDTITRLQAYQEAGADVLYAPGLTSIDDIRTVVESVDRPVNVLALADGPTVADLSAAGVRRVSVGGSFAFAALGEVVKAGRELLDHGTYEFRSMASLGSAAAEAAFHH